MRFAFIHSYIYYNVAGLRILLPVTKDCLAQRGSRMFKGEGKRKEGLKKLLFTNCSRQSRFWTEP